MIPNRLIILRTMTLPPAPPAGVDARVSTTIGWMTLTLLHTSMPLGMSCNHFDDQLTLGPVPPSNYILF